MELKTKNITKQYANHLALSNASIEVPQGTVFGLLGPNGAGKTTLIRIITRITAPDSGEVLINGRPSREEDTYNIGYLPEERGLYRKMKVGEQAMYLARLRGLSKADAHRELMKWFERFDIMSWYNRKVEELSKGMAQKVQFISTVIHNPDLLIFDEPFSGFDPVNAELIKNEMLRLKNEGKTIILSTHNMESVEELCDNIALINKSQVVLQGKVFDIRQQHRSDIYRFRLRGNDFAKDFEITHPTFFVLSQAPYHEFIDLRIKKQDDISNSELAKLFFDRYDVVGFEEELPTMNDIFIKTVS
ncbi:MAG: ATP-binding cassette domain-containing protein [Dysgonamonadaceae bacterium]|jgi:ABC-2 type transport system ATP-binding protein|nr:ATP-binding cassette domain-containing protein [Dysgonamonadaceae bacterium]